MPKGAPIKVARSAVTHAEEGRVVEQPALSGVQHEGGVRIEAGQRNRQQIGDWQHAADNEHRDRDANDHGSTGSPSPHVGVRVYLVEPRSYSQSPRIVARRVVTSSTRLAAFA